MSGLVKLTVGEIGRSRGRRPAPPSPGPEVMVWCCTWSPDGPVDIGRECPDEADLALALSSEDARAVRDGELAPSVAFMQGRLKTAGDNALLLQVLAWTATPAFEAARRQLV